MKVLHKIKHFINSPSGRFMQIASLAGVFLLLLLTLATTVGLGGINKVYASCTSTYKSTVLGDNPVAFWQMDPYINNDNTETDLTGNGHTGTWNGVPTPPNIELQDILPDNCTQTLDFAANLDNYLSIPDSSVFSIPTTGKLTWEGWIHPDVLDQPGAGSNGYTNWMNKCASSNCEWEARFYNVDSSRPNRLSAYAFNLTGGTGSGAFWQEANTSTGSADISPNQWLYVVAEYNITSTPSDCTTPTSYPGSINIWVDGVKWDSADNRPTGCMSQFSVTPQQGSAAVNIGADLLNNAYFQGGIGYVAFYNKLLTNTQILDHWKAMTGFTSAGGSCNASGCTLNAQARGI